MYSKVKVVKGKDWWMVLNFEMRLAFWRRIIEEGPPRMGEGGILE